MLLAASCYNEKPLTSELGTPFYPLEDSSDPIDNFIYNFYNQTGVTILYDYSDMDFQWNLNATSLSNNVLVKPQKSVLQDGIEYVKQILLDCYDNDFRKKYFPIKIMLADTLYRSGYTNDNVYFGDKFCKYGRNYLAIGKIRQEYLSSVLHPDSSDPEAVAAANEIRNEARGRVNGMLIGNLMVANGLLTIPDGFFEVSEGYYEYNVKRDNLIPEQVGIWFVDEENSLNYPMGTSNYMLTPSKEQDVADWVRVITTHSEAQMKELMAGYDALKNKYGIITKAVKDALGIDLQEIGNRYAL